MRMPSGPPPGSASVVATIGPWATGAGGAGAAAAPAGAAASFCGEPHAMPSKLIVPRRRRICMPGRSHKTGAPAHRNRGHLADSSAVHLSLRWRGSLTHRPTGRVESGRALGRGRTAVVDHGELTTGDAKMTRA